MARDKEVKQVCLVADGDEASEIIVLFCEEVLVSPRLNVAAFGLLRHGSEELLGTSTVRVQRELRLEGQDQRRDLGGVGRECCAEVHGA
ncbi:MAG TPA: hypothetical protein VLE46_15375 [Nitrospira sp.]|nr:hypothetical protein [Nitrospira sp.]